MLYLLTPPAVLLQCDSRATEVADLDTLDWVDADRAVTDDVVRLALRFGVETSRGIVFDEIVLHDLDRATILHEANDQSNIDRALVRDVKQDRMEAARPGWTKRGNKTDARVEKAVDYVVDEFDARSVEALISPVNPDLVNMWLRMGGTVPADE